MILPVQTTFRNMDASAAVAERIQEEADKLDKYFDRIASCRVIVEAPHRHHRRGEPFHIRIELRVPGKELVVTRVPTAEHEDQGEWHKIWKSRVRIRMCTWRFATIQGDAASVGGLGELPASNMKKHLSGAPRLGSSLRRQEAQFFWEKLQRRENID
jgi:ribosome-associated translation inhibitor RaiA